MAATNKQMVQKLLTALQTQPAGVVSVVVDGQTVQYDRKQALAELTMWEQRAAREKGRRARVSSINLGG